MILSVLQAFQMRFLYTCIFAPVEKILTDKVHYVVPL